MIKKINEFVYKKGMFILTIFLFLQPILDMFLGIFLDYSIASNLISIFKICFMLFCVYYVCIIKKKNIGYILILFIYCLIFLATNYFLKDNGNIFTELKLLTKNIFLPVTLLFIINLFRTKKFNIKSLYIILYMYIILLFIPSVLNIGFNSYSYSKLGSIGFFYSANAIGAIISILMPLLVGNFIINKNKKHLVLFLTIYLYILVTIGTKAPILCALIVLFYYFIIFITKSIEKKQKYKSLLLIFLIVILAVFCVGIFPSTPFYKNLIIHLEYLNINSFKDLLTFKNFDHFIFSSRLSFLKDSFTVYWEAPIIQKLVGIGYVFNGSLLKTSEMDYFVTLIHQGIFGFIITYYLYFKLLFMIFKSYFKEFKVNFVNINKTSILMSLFISILCAFLAGHVLETPSVCIFVTTILGIAIKEFNIKN